MIIHVVKSGESVYSIARMYGVSPEKVISDNELVRPGVLVPGQTLVILNGLTTHRVMPGESLYSIARQHDTTVEDILAINPQITNPALIYPGQVINVPGETVKLGTIDVNGYAFPGIDITILRKALPYLTYLSIFSYEVRPDGSLSSINDEPLIDEARNAKVAPLMVITNIEEGGSFSSDLARTILSSESVQDTLINNIINTLRAKRYYGLDIDFEYIYPADREKYNDFLRKVVNRLRPLGYIITSALAPKISADQRGLLYEAHDYPVHGALLDHVIIMTYEWGYSFGPPLPVAPLNEVRRVLNYAVSAIPRDKIFMGIPNYGYDWTLPYTRGTSARTLGNEQAVNLAASVGAVINYDLVAQSPYFNYYDRTGRNHIVWFEDARSIEAKLRLANSYNLGGVSYWTINRDFTQNWLVLSSLFNINKAL